MADVATKASTSSATEKFELMGEIALLQAAYTNALDSKDTLANTQISYTTLADALKLSLWATNLTNARVLQAVRPGALETDGFYEPPRRIGVSLELRF